jgi:hypothetical protein
MCWMKTRDRSAAIFNLHSSHLQHDTLQPRRVNTFELYWQVTKFMLSYGKRKDASFFFKTSSQMFLEGLGEHKDITHQVSNPTYGYYTPYDQNPNLTHGYYTPCDRNPTYHMDITHHVTKTLPMNDVTHEHGFSLMHRYYTRS